MTLKRCPFCGCAPELEDGRTIWVVRCQCGACVLGERASEPNIPLPTAYWQRFKQTAVDAWNKRAPTEGRLEGLHLAQDMFIVSSVSHKLQGEVIETVQEESLL